MRLTLVSNLRLTTTNFLLLQLLVAPAFLGPLYYQMPWRNRPLLMFVTLLLAPASYVAVFAYRATVRSLTQPTATRRSVVFTAIRWGLLFGFVFGLLVVASLAVPWLANRLPAIFAGDAIALRRTALEGPFVASFILLHYLLIGAATGGLVGISIEARASWPLAHHVPRISHLDSQDPVCSASASGK
jgi:hypothetical protein